MAPVPTPTARTMVGKISAEYTCTVALEAAIKILPISEQATSEACTSVKKRNKKLFFKEAENVDDHFIGKKIAKKTIPVYYI